MNLCLALYLILTSFDRSEKLKTFIYFNSGVLLQENKDLTPEMEDGALISIYYSLGDTKKRSFKTSFLMTYVRSKQSQ